MAKVTPVNLVNVRGQNSVRASKLEHVEVGEYNDARRGMLMT
jgi:hypothetical protein